MAGLPENSTYTTPSSNPLVPSGFKSTPITGGGTTPPVSSAPPAYNPNSTYKYLAQLKARGNTAGAQLTAPIDPLPGTPEYENAKQASILQYGQLVNNGSGIQTGMPFLSTVGDPKSPIPLPSDYGSFQLPKTIDDNEEKLSWGTPLTPVIRNTIGGDIQGQYIEDTSNPNLLVKTIRGSNPTADKSILNGRPGFMYQIDHIMPLELGGADTLANRQLLNSEENDAKTRAQAVPYTLYAYGKISLKEARTMAMQWRGKDLTDIPQPNGVGLVSDTKGKTGLQIAQDAVKRWSEPIKPAPLTLKGFMAELPTTMKDLGKGFLPNFVREFVKGFASGTTMGFLPYEQGEDQGIGSKVSGIAGMAAGGVASFILGGALIDGALALGGLARGSIAAYRGVAVAEAAKNGFAGAEAVAGLAEGAATAARGAKAATTVFKTLNQSPKYLRNLLTPPSLARAGKLGATSVLIGQGAQFVENKFNPYILSDQGVVQDEGISGTIGNMFKDLSFGVASGIMPPTLKGSAYAAVLPLTLNFIANPDDPTTAITNGIIFGTMHAMGTAKKPGYNDVAFLGGKAYENPSIKAFNETANKAAHASLSYYAPETLSKFSPTDKIPEVVVQKAKDTAIKNIWSRFLLGKDVTPEIGTKTLSDFKTFSKNIETPLNAEKPKLSFSEKFSISARKAASETTKTQNAAIKEQFGKGYQTKNKINEIDTYPLPEVGMDLQTALTEIKRVTASARQLYKGNLTADARNLADVDDLLSFGAAQKQGRFDTQEKFVNPPIAKQAVDSIDESFMKNSFNNNGMNPNGKYPNGDAALTGAALELNKSASKYFFEQKAAGNASPNILLIDRSDTAPLWRMKNDLLSEKDISSKNYAKDINPENALQAFGVVKDPQTGIKSLVPLGWMASDFRLNEATGKGHTAFNKHPAVLKYQETSGAEGLRPLDLHKDQIVPTMRKEGISVLVANLDPRATFSTVETGNPFIPVNLNDANWEYSIKLGNRLSQQKNTNPISMAISKVANALEGEQKVNAIREMNQNIVKPAADYIPKATTNGAPQSEKIIVPQETTRNIVQEIGQSLDVAGPAQVKEAFQKNFGIMLQDEQAVNLFNRRNDMTMRDGVKALVDAYNQSGGNVNTAIRLNFMKTYLESGALQVSDTGKAVLDMRLLGKMENIRPTSQTQFTPEEIKFLRKQGFDDNSIMKMQGIGTIKPSFINETRSTVTQPTIQPNLENLSGKEKARAIIARTDELVNKPEPPIEANLIGKQPTITQPTVQPTGGLHEKIVKEYLNVKKPKIATTVTSLTPAETTRAISAAKNYIPEGIAAIEDAQFGGRGYSLPDYNSIIAGLEKRVQLDLKSRNMPDNIIKEANNQIRTALENHISSIVDTRTRSGIGPEVQFGDTSFIERPKFVAREFYKSIDDGMADSNPGAKYFSKSLDTVLETVVGPDYRNNTKLPKILADYFNNVFFSETNPSGREITQHKDIVNARGAGDFAAEKAAYVARKTQLAQNDTGKSGGLTNKEIAAKGIEAGEEGSGFSGMNVKPWYQDDSMVHDLTKGEDMISALFSETPQGAATAVRAIKNLTLGTSGNIGLREYLLKNLPDAKTSSIPFATIEKDAMAVDKAKADIDSSNIEQTKRDQIELEQLRKSAEVYSKMIEDIMKNPSESLSTGITPEILKENFSDINDAIKRINEKNNGTGGPGYTNNATKYNMGGLAITVGSKIPDGKGGIGSFFGDLWNKLKNGNVTTYAAPVKPTYDFRGMKVTDDDIMEAAKILPSEISNRPGKIDFEVNNVLNTVINRSKTPGLDYGKTLTQILQRPAQYQGYAPDGVIQKGGKVMPSQYQMYSSGKLDAPSQKKYQAILDYLNKIKTTGLEDTTGGQIYYVHASDGTQWLGKTIQEAKNRANQHEKQNRLQITPWGTSVGLPTHIVER